MDSKEIRKLLYLRLKALIDEHCKKNKITISQFARTTGLDKAGVANYVATDGVMMIPNSVTLYKLFKALPDVDANKFFDIEVGEKITKPTNFSARVW